MNLSSSLLLLACFVGLPGCGGISASSDAGATDAFVEDPQCRSDRVEADLQIVPAGDAGPGLAVAPGSYVISTTYIRIANDPTAQQAFRDDSARVLDTMATTDGVMGYRLGLSTRCLSARTLVVWRDEAAMYRFVASAAHTQAVADVGVISRGGSVVTHWADDGTGASFERAAHELGASDGPMY